MTGLPTLAVYLESAAGTFVTHDITQYVELAQGWGFRRGRNDEDAEIEPATAQFVLTNRDGRFTLGAANYDGITVDKRIQVRETVGGTTYTRFTGYVQQWPTEWDSALGVTAKAKITAVDRQSRLNRRKLLSGTEQEILADSPTLYYRLSEAAGALSAGDFSGNGRNSLPATTAASTLPLVGDGTTPLVFGSDAVNGWDGQSSCLFASGQFLRGEAWTSSSTSATIEFAFKATAPPASSQTLLTLNPLNGAALLQHQIIMNTDGTVETFLGNVGGPINYADGAWHHWCLTVAGAVWNAYVDGVLVDTNGAAPFSLSTSNPYEIIVGSNASGSSRFSGWMAHVAVTQGVLSAGRIADHSDAILNGFDTESTDARIARLAGYAGIATADQNLETGITTVVPASGTSGQPVFEAMRAVVDAEGGVLFIAGDGDLTFHNRAHRITSATSTADLTIAADYIDEDVTVDADKDYLVNTATGSRTGGAEQRAANQTSIDTFDEYPDDHGTLLLTTDDEVLQLLNWQVGAYSTISTRVSSVTFDLLTLSQAQVQSLLALELGDYVRITGMPSQSPSSALDLIVEGIKEDQQLSDRSSKWEITFNTAPAALFRAWILGNATYGVLGSTTKLHW